MSIWKGLKGSSPVWYFDATGKVIKNIGRTCTYLYSMVMHDTINNKIIPAAEFATNSHTVENISKYLLVIKQHYKEVAPFIVVDESYALINSIMSIFNGCDILAYINWTWKILNGKIMKYFLQDYLNFRSLILGDSSNMNLHCAMSTRLFICHTHLFKNMIRKCDKLLKKRKEKNSLNIKSLFQYCFTLLQNSTSLDEFTSHLELCFKIFCSKNCAKISIEKVNNMINKRNIKLIADIHDPLKLNNQSEKFKEEDGYYGLYLRKNGQSSIVEKSSYSQYFRVKIKKFRGINLLFFF